jgi:hypothetical protein
MFAKSRGNQAYRLVPLRTGRPANCPAGALLLRGFPYVNFPKPEPELVGVYVLCGQLSRCYPYICSPSEWKNGASDVRALGHSDRLLDPRNQYEAHRASSHPLYPVNGAALGATPLTALRSGLPGERSRLLREPVEQPLEHLTRQSSDAQIVIVQLGRGSGRVLQKAGYALELLPISGKDVTGFRRP